jgi:hypothetical protein
MRVLPSKRNAARTFRFAVNLLMNVKRTVMIGAAVGAVAVWIAAAATSNTRSVVPVVSTKPTVVDKSGAALAVEVRRLHERLRPSDTPSHSRDLFQYAARSSSASRSTVAPLPVAPPPAISDAPAIVAPLKLEGLAEDRTDQGPARTAIISGFGEIFIVKEGESVTLRYRVAKISAEAVELTDLNDNTPLRLALR